MNSAQYIRNRVAINESEQALLAQKHVAVVGCGGLGGYVVELLGRVGVGYMRVIDPDIFEESNLNRQLLSSRLNLGKPKVLAAKQRMQAINPDVTVEAVQARFGSENFRDLLDGVDLVLDCLDTIADRRLLQKACKDLAIPFIHAAVAGWRGQVCLIQPGDDLLDFLYPNQVGELNEDNVYGALSFTVASVAAMQCAEATKYLLGKIYERKVLYLIDFGAGRFNQIKL